MTTIDDSMILPEREADKAITDGLATAPMVMAQNAQGVSEQVRGQFVSTLQDVSTINPDEFAKAMTLERLSGIPADTLMQHREQTARLLEGNKYAAIYDRARRTSDALMDGRVAAVAHDDIEQLARIESAQAVTDFNKQSLGEKLWGSIKQAMLSSSQATGVGYADSLARINGQFDRIDQELVKAAAEGREPFADGGAPEGFGREYLNGSPEQRAEMRKNLETSLGEAVTKVTTRQEELQALPLDPGQIRYQELGGDTAANMAEAIAENPGFAVRSTLGSIAGSAEMLAAGAIGGPVAAGLIEFGGEFGGELRSILAEAKIDLNDPKAILKALQDDKLMVEARGKAARKAAVTTAVDMLSFGIAGRLLVPKAIGGKALTGVQREGINLLVQAPVQGALGGLSEAAGQYAADGKVSGGDVLLEAVAGVGMSSAEVAAFGGRRIFDNVSQGLAKSRQAKQAAGALDQMVDASLNSKTRGRDPQTMGAIVEQQLKDTPMEMLSIPAEVMAQLNQDGTLPALLATVPGLTEQFAEAAASGGDVVMKTADYLAHFADYHDLLSSHVRMGIEGMSIEDAAQWQDAQAAEVEGLLASLKREPGDYEQAYTSTVGELLGAGYRKQDAEQYAATHTAALSTLAERTGKTISELSARFQLTIRNEAPAALQAVPVDEMRLMINRLRTGDIPSDKQAKGQTLGEWLRSSGGLVDSGGELAALDVDVGKVGSNRLVRQGGMTLDDAAMAALERGYFPGLEREEVGPQIITDAIASELSGNPRYSVAQENERAANIQENLQRLNDYLQRIGADVDTMTDDQVLAMMRGDQAQGGQQLNQAQTKDQLLAGLIAEFPGLKLDLFGNGQTVILSRIVIPDNQRNAGAGTKVMNRITAWADQNRKRIALTPSADFGGNKKRLTEFYKRFGFVENKGKNKDYELSEAMYRDSRLSQSDSQLNQVDESGPRGFISFSEGANRQFQITVTGRRDLSTLLHEFGHYYLEVLSDLASDADAPQQIKDDIRTIREWTGAGEDGAFGVEQHEQFARGFERYLAEGKAPNPELQGAFARFKRWIIGVYKDLRRLNVQLTPEIIRVMDRIVATDEQIQAAEQVTQAVSLFESAEKAGMTEAEFADYQNSLDLAREEATLVIERQIAREEELRRSKWWREETARVREEVAEEVDLQPVYAAMRALRKGVLPDGTQSTIKLNSAELREVYGLAAYRKFVGMVSREGMGLDVAAQVLGYDSGDALVKDILAAPPRAEVIKQEADTRMVERHGAKASGESTDLAMAAVHNEKRGAVLIKELHALGKQAGKKTVTTQSILKATAERIMSSRKVREISPFEYQRAEGKAGRLAFEAAAKGDLQAAYKHKQEQLLNFHLWREARKARESVDTIVSRMAKYNRDSTRKRLGKAGHEYLDQIDAVMEQYEFRNVSLRELDKRVNFNEWYIRQLEAGNEPFVPEFILNTQGRVNYKDLSLAQLQELDDFTANVSHLAGLKNKLLGQKRMQDFEEAKNAMVAAARINLEARKPLPIDRGTMTLLERSKDWTASLSSSLLKMEQIIEWLDGGDIEGPWRQTLWNPFVDAQVAKDDLNREFTIKLADLMSAYIEQRGKKSMAEQVHIPEIGQSLTRNGIISAALNTGNESNRSKLLKGYGWDERQLGAILQHMTKADWEFTQQLWDLVESLWPQIEALEKAVHGIAPEKVERRQVVTADGTFEGGYWPLVYDTSSAKYAQVATSADGPALENAIGRATTPKGHTKARVDGFAAPIMLDTSVVVSHLGSVIHDLTHRRAIMDAAKIIGNSEIKRTLNDVLGVRLADQFNPWLQGIANDQTLDSQKGIDGWTRMLNGLRSNLSIAWMGFSATTGLQQVLGLSQSFELFAQKGGRRYLLKGIKDFVRQPFETIRTVREMSGEMRNREQNLDASMRETIGRLAGKNSSLAIIQRLSFKLINIVQATVDYPTWLAGYHQAMDEGLSPEVAIQAGDRAVRLSQMAAGPKDLAAVQRKDGLMRALTIVYSYFNLLYNRQVDIKRQLQTAKGMADYLNAFERTMLLMVIPAVAGPLLLGQGPEDDETWAEWAGAKILAYQFMGIPGVRDIASALESGWGYRGATPLGSVGETMVRLSGAVTADEPDAQRLTMLMFDTAGYTLGLPAAQPKRTAKYLFEVSDGKHEDDNLLEFMRGLLLGPPKEN